MGREHTLPVLGPVAVLALFAGACALPAGYYEGKFLEEGVTADGLGLLAFGWSAFLIDPPVALAWLANPLLAAGLVCQWRRRFAGAAKCAGAALGLSLLPLAVLLIDWTVSVRSWPDPALVGAHGWGNEVLARAELRPGYFLWVTAHGVLFGLAAVCWIGAHGRRHRSRRRRRPRRPSRPMPGSGRLTMTRTLLPHLLFAATAAGAAPLKKAADRPSELEGKWVVTAATTLGQEQEHLVGLSLVIRGDRYTVSHQTQVMQGRVMVDNTANPKRAQFEVVHADGKADEKKGRWVYELAGDELRMASYTDSDGAVPDKIDPADHRQMVWKAKRVKD
jgi:uncharacterized protein (TIGR03067 family)